MWPDEHLRRVPPSGKLQTPQVAGMGFKSLSDLAHTAMHMVAIMVGGSA
jgi:hypothetical protein